MEKVFYIFILIGTFLGCFPTAFPWILKNDSSNINYNQKKWRLWPLFVFILIVAQIFDHWMNFDFTSITWSSKVKYYVGFTSSYMPDILFRIFGLIYGPQICQLLYDLNQFKPLKSSLTHEEIHRGWIWASFFIINLLFHLVYIILRTVIWHNSNTLLKFYLSFLWHEEIPMLVWTVYFTIHISDIVTRNFALSLTLHITLKLSTIYRILAEKTQAQAEVEVDQGEKIMIVQTQQTLDKEMMKVVNLKFNIPPASIENNEEAETGFEAFIKMKNMFKIYNDTIGPYALVLVAMSVGRLAMDFMFMSMESSDNMVHGVSIGVGLTLEITTILVISYLGHLLESQVKMTREEFKILLMQKPKKCNPMLKSLSKWKWRWEPIGILTINLSLIPRLIAGFFSIMIFHLQPKISEQSSVNFTSVQTR